MLNEYIKKSDIIKLLEDFVECDIIWSLPEDIASLPTIDPEGVLEKMI